MSPNIRGVGFSTEALLPRVEVPLEPTLLPWFVGVDGLMWLLLDMDAWLGELLKKRTF